MLNIAYLIETLRLRKTQRNEEFVQKDFEVDRYWANRSQKRLSLKRDQGPETRRTQLSENRQGWTAQLCT